MSEGDALMRAILDQPDDDTPRLVYADWLDEQGNAEQKARAEFIRSQVQNGDHNRQCALVAKWGIGWMPRIGRKCAADDEVTTFFSGTRVNQRQTRGPLFATRTFTFNRGFMTQFTNTISGGMMFDGARDGANRAGTTLCSPVPRVPLRDTGHDTADIRCSPHAEAMAAPTQLQSPLVASRTRSKSIRWPHR